MFGIGNKLPKRRLESVSVSDRGLVRPDNQDSLYADDTAHIFCVADGMGGGSEGGRASQLVCDRLRRAKLGAMLRPLADVTAAIDSTLANAHAEISTYAKAQGFEQMGTTAAVVVFDGFDLAHAAIGHIGDSRVYRIRRGMAEPLTRDHTVGMVFAESAGRQAAAFRNRKNPLAHVLTRAIGVTEGPLQVEWSETDVRAGDRFLICSDGVHDVVSDARLAVFVGAGTLASAQKRLTQEVLAQGAHDNFSFIIIEVREIA